MTPQTAIVKLRLRLNKLHSSDYDNIPDWTAVEAINKAALEWTRRNIRGNNMSQDVAEETLFRVDDLQFLLKPADLKGRNNNLFFQSNSLPSDYLWYSRIIPVGNCDECFNKRMKSYFVEEVNIPQIITDWSWRPSFEWRQTIHTMVGNRIRVYTNGEFNIDKIELLYYRKPVSMDIEGYDHLDGSSSANVNLEFKDDIAEIIIDEAASIIAGDIESLNSLEITKERAKSNN